VCRSKHVEHSIYVGIINSITRLYLVGCCFYWFILRCTDPWMLNKKKWIRNSIDLSCVWRSKYKECRKCEKLIGVTKYELRESSNGCFIKYVALSRNLYCTMLLHANWGLTCCYAGKVLIRRNKRSTCLIFIHNRIRDGPSEVWYMPFNFPPLNWLHCVASLKSKCVGALGNVYCTVTEVLLNPLSPELSPIC
jgi:hypothetical protein